MYGRVATLACDTSRAGAGHGIRARFDGVSSLAYVIRKSKEYGVQANSLVEYYPSNLGSMVFDNIKICVSYTFLVNAQL